MGFLEFGWINPLCVNVDETAFDAKFTVEGVG